MQRTALIALFTVVVAASIAATATILLTASDDETVALPAVSSGPTPVASADIASPLRSPGAPVPARRTSPPARSSNPAASATITPDPTITPAPTVKIRTAESVDCGKERHFCSSVDEMSVEGSGDELRVKSFDEASDIKNASRPSIVMESRPLDKSRGTLGPGEKVAFLDVEVTVTNEASDTFVFDKREIVLEVFRNGQLYDSFSTEGEGFEMTPGSKMTGEFDRPITQSGNYSWRAKIWYYRK